MATMLLDAGPLLSLALVLVAGVVFGALANRLRAPSVTGQIVGGIVIGHSVLGVFHHASIQQLTPVIDFALALMAVAVGSHLRVRRLANAKRRLALLLAFECTLTPLLVFSLTRGLAGADLPLSLLLAAISISTAPATVLAIVREERAHGVFTKTLLAGVALNNLACIFLFEAVRSAARNLVAPDLAHGVLDVLAAPLRQLGLSALLGGGAGVLLVAATRGLARPDRRAAVSLVAILLVAGLAEQLGISSLLSCLCLGICLANLTPSREEIGHAVFSNLEYAVFAVFFTIAGMELQPATALAGGALAGLVFVGRLGGKLLAASSAMRLAGATRSLRHLLGPALIPQAGLAVGLTLRIAEDGAFAGLRDALLSCVLAVVLLNELLGPALTRSAVVRSGEAGKDKPGPLDFLHEEHLVLGLVARTQEEAIGRLVDHLFRTRRLGVARETFLADVQRGELVRSTRLGGGIAVPAGRLPREGSIVGVLGLAPHGIGVEGSDGRPVRCVLLLGLPEGREAEHMRITAAFAATLGNDPELFEELCTAPSAAHAYDLLHAGDRAVSLNTLLDEDVPTQDRG